MPPPGNYSMLWKFEYPPLGLSPIGERVHCMPWFSFHDWCPEGGLEPPRPCGLQILSPLRLPVPNIYSKWCRTGFRHRTQKVADWPSEDQSSEWHASLPGGKVPVCGKCAALRKNALHAKHAILRAHLTDSMTLADFSRKISLD